MTSNFELIAGVDEVGRGPLAGPVVTAAVILNPDKPIVGLMDSKALTECQRECLAEKIKQHALAWSLGRAEVVEIDRINILQATMLAMQRCVQALPIVPHLVLVDGNRCPPLSIKTQAIIKGDQSVAAISAASIVAKVARDQEMQELDRSYPGYGLAQHKGYPTKAHIRALHQLGVTEIHRRTFSPVRQMLNAITT